LIDFIHDIFGGRPMVLQLYRTSYAVRSVLLAINILLVSKVALLV